VPSNPFALRVSSPNEGTFLPYASARRLLLAAMAIGLVLPIVFALQASSASQFASSATVGVATVAACLAAGGLLGFVFGVPRQLQDGRAAPRPSEVATAAPDDLHSNYASNTSLEQISDWLTKILVGVGLTQLANIPSGLVSVGTFVAGGLGELPGADVFATGLVVFGVLDGFFLSYLWTRLYLPSLFAEADLRAALASARKEGFHAGETRAIDLTISKPGSREGAAARRLGLWVDDAPGNNTNVMQWLQSVLPIDWHTARSTEEAMTELRAHRGDYAVVITDMGRPEGPRAGYDLLSQMRQAGIETPVIVYSGSDDPKHDDEAKARGALGSTNSPTKLHDLVKEAIRAD
jgi:CheY-like chemotaxis protein